MHSAALFRSLARSLPSLPRSYGKVIDWMGIYSCFSILDYSELGLVIEDGGVAGDESVVAPEHHHAG